MNKYFPKSRINSTLLKTALIFCFLCTSCSSKLDSNTIIGKWKVKNITLNNSPSAFDSQMLDDIFYYNLEWEFESDGSLIQKESFTNLNASFYRVEGNMLRFYKSKDMIPSELILAKKNRELFDFSKVELEKIRNE
ncbi:hypothetical protein [Nonlabens xylanidelens]|nr:hypothetical protein [Nonlabens xylanidelens]